ncbi:hypothetical protein FYJ26_06685 [Anaerococcus sp. WCA-380-WT-2B]|uniref:Uncharacterized protein n=2 Tax=Anaerococcus porci TaxID=2652269 RepID=A0A6N7VT95_9FIRM|nr:hypothetical protein [Anaerococcus porci]MSS78086.1 hypothetical protein [Anaerococcus porci]
MDNKVFKIILGIIVIIIGLKLAGFILSLFFGLAFPIIFCGGFILVPLMLLGLSIAIPVILIYGIYKYFFKKDSLN